MKTCAVRKEESKLRQEGRKKRSAKEQIAKLDQKLGKNVGAKKERARLAKEVKNEFGKGTTKD